jgi:tetratricopeptide (TPR) repeat protein
VAEETIRFEPYYLDETGDDRLMSFADGQLGVLLPGFSIPHEQTDYRSRENGRTVRTETYRFGTQKGTEVTIEQQFDDAHSRIVGRSVLIEAFGLPSGSKFRLNYDRNTTSGFLELKAAGDEGRVQEIAGNFKKEFAPPSEEQMGEARKAMTDALMNQSWGEAEDIANGVLLWRPNDVEALMTMGTCLSLRQQDEAAKQVLARVLELEPGSPRALFNLGSIYRSSKEYDKAVEHYSRALAGMPGSASYTFVLATAYEEKGDIDKAVEMFRKAAESKPEEGAPVDFRQEARDALQRLGQ